MHIKLIPFLAGCMISASLPLGAAEYADSVVAYSTGTGYATDFSTGEGFTNAAAALGEPSRTTPGPFGGPVDPFNPPYLKDQLVSIGAGGSLTLGLSSPILNNPNNPFGLDFIIFGNAGFVITNNNFSGGGITDGTLFGSNPGATRVWVSADNVSYYELNPARTAGFDSLYPTDGAGDFELPVDPTLAGSDFGGLDLAGIRSRYHGSGGGSGFDIGWAIDSAGQAVVLPEVRFIRLDVLSGAAEVDGLAAVNVVPEPPPWTLLPWGVALLFCGRFFPARAGLRQPGSFLRTRWLFRQ